MVPTSSPSWRFFNTLSSATVTDEHTFNSAFNTIPLNNYTGKNFPTDTTAANYDLIKNVTVDQQTVGRMRRIRKAAARKSERSDRSDKSHEAHRAACPCQTNGSERPLPSQV